MEITNLNLEERETRESISKLVQTVDRSNLRNDFEQWPSLAKSSWDVATPIIDHEPRSVLIAGMGGSGIVGEIAYDLALETGSRVQIRVLKDYHLPPDIDASSVVIGVSCSGNTEETLTVLHEAAKRGLKGYTFGTGGMIESFSKKNPGYTFTRTSMLKVPRSSLPALLFPVLKFLIQSKILELRLADVNESLEVIQGVRNNAGDINDIGANTSYSFAMALASTSEESSSIPLVYSTRRTRATGMRFRQSLNENAKMHSYDGAIPELCHNEIVGWDAGITRVLRSDQMELTSVPICLSLNDDPEELRGRFEIIREIIARNGGKSLEPPVAGRSFFARLMSLLYWLDYSTYYAAILRGIDPIGTPSIDFLKVELQKRLDYLKRFR